MKKFLTAAALLLILCLMTAWASSGDAGDPLISLSYLEGTFSQSLDPMIGSRLDAADGEVRDSVQKHLSSLTAAPEGPATAGNTTLKEGDVLSGSTGLTFTPLEGAVRLSGGTAVDVTAGREAGPGLLEAGHRYVVAENASVEFTVSSPAAVVSWTGGSVLTLSSQLDYYAIAKALRSLDLFRGSGSGVGEGFGLHLAPTRGEGLVMFIRILGEEAEALACTDGHPFTDVPGWLDPYVAWAYRQGYSNGVSATEFDPDAPIAAAEYQELLLRALGYSAAGTDDYSTSLERALDCGVLRESEYALLTGRSFLRAHVVYLSCYSLDMTLSGTSQTLGQRMVDGGVLTGEQLASARALTETLRLT